MIDPHAQFLAILRVLTRDFNRYVTLDMFTNGVYGSYDTFKKNIPNGEDLTDR